MFLSFLRGVKNIFSRSFHRSNDNKVVRAFPECQHMYHQECLIKWFMENDTCPMCRRRSSSTCIDEDAEDPNHG